MPSTPWPSLVVAGLLGLAIASFLNVVAYRVPRGESVNHPPSACPRCGTRIKARHNVPVVGWLVLHGRCASCHLPISRRYPVVEAAGGAILVALTAIAGVGPALPAYGFSALALLIIGLVELDQQRLPIRWAMTVFASATLVLATAALVAGEPADLARALAALAVPGLVFFALRTLPTDRAVLGLKPDGSAADKEHDGAPDAPGIPRRRSTSCHQ